MGERAFRVELSPGAERDLQSFPPEIQRAIASEIQRWLKHEPFKELKTRIKRLAGFAPPLYRLRVGDYRVYYRIAADLVAVLAILHKKDSERWLKRR